MLFRVPAVKAENGMVMAFVALAGGFWANLANVLVKPVDVAQGVGFSQTFGEPCALVGGEGDEVAIALFELVWFALVWFI